MPRNLPHYAQCASPGEAHSFDTPGNIFGQILFGILFGAMVAGGWIVLALMGVVAGFGCGVGLAFGAFVIYEIAAFKDWYYSRRLMCVAKDRCAVGTVVGEPHDALDGDRKIDILIAPFSPSEAEQFIVSMLDGMRSELPGVPQLPELQNPETRFQYIRGLEISERNRLYVRMADERMFVQSSRCYQRHYYRRDVAAMSAEAFAHSPDDTLASATPNPMFRYCAEEGDDPEERVIVPWMHCEVEGNRLGRWLDNVLVGFVVAFMAYATICVFCTVVTAGVGVVVCGWVGGLITALLGLLAWLVAHIANSPDDAVAGEIEVDVEDSAFETGSTESRPGDVVLVFGDWVMDTEHEKYFEIHPVKAYYLVCGSPKSPSDWKLKEDGSGSECVMGSTAIAEDDFRIMCEMVHAAETTEPSEKLVVDAGSAMAMVR